MLLLAVKEQTAMLRIAMEGSMWQELQVVSRS